jgi:hypothetical protein
MHRWSTRPRRCGESYEERREKRRGEEQERAFVHAAFYLLSCPLSLPLLFFFLFSSFLTATMQNDAGEVVDLYLPRKWYGRRGKKKRMRRERFFCALSAQSLRYIQQLPCSLLLSLFLIEYIGIRVKAETHRDTEQNHTEYTIER